MLKHDTLEGEKNMFREKRSCSSCSESLTEQAAGDFKPENLPHRESCLSRRTLCPPQTKNITHFKCYSCLCCTVAKAPIARNNFTPPSLGKVFLHHHLPKTTGGKALSSIARECWKNTVVLLLCKNAAQPRLSLMQTNIMEQFAFCAQFIQNIVT